MWLAVLIAYSIAACTISTLDSVRLEAAQGDNLWPAHGLSSEALLSSERNNMDSNSVHLHTPKKPRHSGHFEGDCSSLESDSDCMLHRLIPSRWMHARRLSRSDSPPDSGLSSHDSQRHLSYSCSGTAPSGTCMSTADYTFVATSHKVDRKEADDQQHMWRRSLSGETRKLGNESPMRLQPGPLYPSMSPQMSDPGPILSGHNSDLPGLHAQIEKFLASGSQPSTVDTASDRFFKLPQFNRCFSDSHAAHIRAERDAVSSSFDSREFSFIPNRTKDGQKELSLDKLLSDLRFEAPNCVQQSSFDRIESKHRKTVLKFDSSSDSEDGRNVVLLASLPPASGHDASHISKVGDESSSYEVECNDKKAQSQRCSETMRLGTDSCPMLNVDYKEHVGMSAGSPGVSDPLTLSEAQTKIQRYMSCAEDATNALELAVGEQDFDAVPALVALGARGDIAEPPPLIAAANYGHVQAVQALLPHHAGSKNFMHIARVAIRQAMFHGHAGAVHAVLGFALNRPPTHSASFGFKSEEKSFSLGSATLNITFESLVHAIMVADERPKESQQESLLAPFVRALDILVSGAPTADIAMMLVNGDNPNLTGCTSLPSSSEPGPFRTPEDSPNRALLDSAKSTPYNSQKSTPYTSLQNTPERPVISFATKRLAHYSRILFDRSSNEAMIEADKDRALLKNVTETLEKSISESSVVGSSAAEVPDSPHRYKTPERSRTPVRSSDGHVLSVQTPERSVPSTPEKVLRTPEKCPRTPEKCPRTPEKCPKTPEKCPKTPEKCPKTPEKYQRTPEKYKRTPEPHLKTPERRLQREHDGREGLRNSSRSSSAAKDRQSARHGGLRNNGLTARQTSTLVLRSRLMRELFVMRAERWRREVAADLVERVDRAVIHYQSRLKSLALLVSDICGPLIQSSRNSPGDDTATVDSRNLNEFLLGPHGPACIMQVFDSRRYASAASLLLVRLDFLLDAACAESSSTTHAATEPKSDHDASDIQVMSVDSSKAAIVSDPMLLLLATILDMDSDQIGAIVKVAGDGAAQMSSHALSYAVLHDQCEAAVELVKNGVPVPAELLLRADVGKSLCAPDLMALVSDDVLLGALLAASRMQCVALRLEAYVYAERPAVAEMAAEYYLFADATSETLAALVARVGLSKDLGSASNSKQSPARIVGLSRCAHASGMRSLLLESAANQGQWPLVFMLLQCGALAERAGHPELVPRAVQTLQDADRVHMLVSVLGVHTSSPGLVDALISAASDGRMGIVHILLKEARAKITFPVVTALHRCSEQNAAACHVISLAPTSVLASVIVAIPQHQLVYNELSVARRDTWRADMERLDRQHDLPDPSHSGRLAFDASPTVFEVEKALTDSLVIRTALGERQMPYYEVSGYESPVNAGLTAEEIAAVVQSVLPPVPGRDMPGMAVVNCPICAESLFSGEIDDEHVPVSLPCNHAFHKVCVAVWLQKVANCPICRRNLRPEDSSF